jgi:hypothetical protein
MLLKAKNLDIKQQKGTTMATKLKSILVRLSAEEKAKIEKKAKKHLLSTSAYCRASLNKIIKD